jgi:hypothetical protein
LAAAFATGLAAAFLAGAFLAGAFLAAGFAAGVFLAAGLATGAFLAATFLAAGFTAAFLLAGFLAAGLAAAFFATGFAAAFLATGFLASAFFGAVFDVAFLADEAAFDLFAMILSHTAINNGSNRRFVVRLPLDQGIASHKYAALQQALNLILPESWKARPGHIPICRWPQKLPPARRLAYFQAPNQCHRLIKNARKKSARKLCPGDATQYI